MRSCYGLLIVALCTCIAGCAGTPRVVTKTIKVPVYVPIELSPQTKKLFEPLPIAEPSNNTVAEALQVAKERKTTIRMCNARLNCIWESINGRECRIK